MSTPCPWRRDSARWMTQPLATTMQPGTFGPAGIKDSLLRPRRRGAPSTASTDPVIPHATRFPGDRLRRARAIVALRRIRATTTGRHHPLSAPAIRSRGLLASTFPIVSPPRRSSPPAASVAPSPDPPRTVARDQLPPWPASSGSAPRRPHRRAPWPPLLSRLSRMSTIGSSTGLVLERAPSPPSRRTARRGSATARELAGRAPPPPRQ
jgi:hypothetical protein